MSWLRVALVLLAACGGARARDRPPPPPGAILGTWALADGSDVVMEIGAGSPPVIRAWSTGNRTDFEVSGVSFDGRRLRATFRYPPTGIVTTSDLELISVSRLEGHVSGAYTGRETWLRVE